MRDIGAMGENSFSLWCAQAGLFANKSEPDKTGWDFYVEFPFENGLEADEIHKSAIECKVQVKSTDCNKGKVSISLSNLRRLVTALMPSFLVFIEFGGRNEAESCFVVHVDNELITKVLKRLHESEQLGRGNSINKRTLTIHYNQSHLVKNVNGEQLKEIFQSYIGNDISKYIADKKAHLASTGFENGRAEINFTIDGIYNLKKLIDVSLGIEKTAEIKSFKGTKTRFGILSKSPFVDAVSGELSLPDLKPYSEGTIKFKEDNLSLGYSFYVKLFLSPFNVLVPHEYKKARIEGDFFNLIFYPFSSKSELSFSFGEGIRLEIRKLRDALALLNLLCTKGKNIYLEFCFNNFPNLTSVIESHGFEYFFSNELKALNAACNILQSFNIFDKVDVSLLEISRYSESICQFNDTISSTGKIFKTEFEVENDDFSTDKETVNIFLASTKIGSHAFGALMTIKGSILVSEEKKYAIISNTATLEKRIVSQNGSVIDKKDLMEAIKSIEEKYLPSCQVVTICESNSSSASHPSEY